jgi:hypothetical protein
MDDALATPKTSKSGGKNQEGILAGTVFSGCFSSTDILGCPAHYPRLFRRRHRVKEDPMTTIVERLF